MLQFDEIKVSPSQDYFLYNDQMLFGRKYKQVLKFHKEGLAAVADETGWYHIALDGKPIYEKKYTRTFGYYYGRAAVNDNGQWFHIDIGGQEVYQERYAWCGNFQEKKCTVRDIDNLYFHIDHYGKPLYLERYRYAGDFKDGAACVCLADGFWQHIDSGGRPVHAGKFLDLGIFHKSLATARDDKGWMHIDRRGQPVYQARFRMVEPFYNGQAFVEMGDGSKAVIRENGQVVIKI